MMGVAKNKVYRACRCSFCERNRGCPDRRRLPEQALLGAWSNMISFSKQTSDASRIAGHLDVSFTGDRLLL